jgi:hypothetical protein
MNCSSDALLRRYLEAVAVWLPASQRDDIAAEIGDNLRSRIEEQEVALRRPLTEDELVELLKRRGHPMAVAGNYSTQQCLIGPALFPIYRFLVKLVILWIQLPLFALVIGPLTALASPHPIAVIVHTAGTYLMAVITAFTVITLVFASVERYRGKTAYKWDPRSLPGFPVSRVILDADPRVWARGLTQAVFSALFAVAWQYVVQHWNAFHFGMLGSKLDPILQATYWPIMASLLTGIAQGLAAVVVPGKAQLRGIFRLMNAVVSLIVLGILFDMRAIEAVAARFLPAGTLTGTNADWIRVALQLPLVIIALAIVADAAMVLRELQFSRGKKNWSLHPAPGK